jgi:hypothetical protein
LNDFGVIPAMPARAGATSKSRRNGRFATCPDRIPVEIYPDRLKGWHDDEKSNDFFV